MIGLRYFERLEWEKARRHESVRREGGEARGNVK